MQYFFGIMMFVTALYLILLVLIQRGRGGGLAGALGGAGGQSAFGAKAGDTFTKVTIYSSAFWILLCIAAVWFMNRQVVADAPDESTIGAPAGTSEEIPGGGLGSTTPEDPATANDGATDTDAATSDDSNDTATEED